MAYLFTSESVSEGHPDKVADQISDALIDNFLAFDPESKVACETLVTTGQVVLAGAVLREPFPVHHGDRHLHAIARFDHQPLSLVLRRIVARRDFLDLAHL